MSPNDRLHQKPFNPWHLLWIAVIASELFTALLTTIQHHFSPEGDLWYLLRVGAIDSLFVPLIVAPVIMYFLLSTKKLKKINEQLQHEIAERTRTESVLHTQEERLRLAMEATRQGWFDLNIHTGVANNSPEYARILGYEPQEFNNDIKGWIENIHPMDRDSALKAFNECIETSEPRTIEYRRRTKTGEWKWIRSIGKVVGFDTDKKPLRMIGTHADISDRKQAEDALRTSEELLQAVIDSSADSIFFKDIQGRYILMNKAGSDLLGISAADVIGKDDTSLFPPEEAARIMADDRNIITTASTTMNENSLTMAGVRRVLQVRKGPVFDDQGNVRGVYGISRDITERRQIEDALRSSESRFRSIIENASAGILVIDLETRRIRYANPAICRMLRYEEQEFVTLSITDLAMPDDLAALTAGFQAHAEGKVNTMERTLRSKDGSSIRMAINSVLMDIDERQCLVGFFADVSEKHLLEEERLKIQKLEAIGTLAGGIAHDFNNLLQGVFGYISLAKLTVNDRKKSMDALEQAEKALHMSVRLTNQLLTFSKGGKPVKNVVNILPVIENAAKFALSGSRSNCRIVADTNLWQADMDEGQVGQVIQNIVLNADQAMPEGGLVEISAKNIQLSRETMQKGLPEGRYLEITIKDHGIGIPEQYLAKIFDPYFTTKEKGSGLGLATAYSIIKNHNGLIEVKSRMGEGSAFGIYLPAVGPAQKLDHPGLASKSTESRVGRVLVMDDEQVIRDVARELLMTLGHEVEFAKNGKEAVDKYEVAMRSGKPFDLVILDLTVRGGMGGADAMMKLHRMDPAVNAVVSSGYSDDSISSSYRANGFKAFLKKPYTIDALRAVLGRLLSR